MRWAVIYIVVSLGLYACAEPPKPRSIADLMADRILLDAVLIRCNENRSAARDDPECQNARVAVERLDALERERIEAERQAAFERQREALRRRNDQLAELRRRELEQEQSVFGTPVPPPPSGGVVDMPPGQAPSTFGAPLADSVDGAMTEPAPVPGPAGAAAPPAAADVAQQTTVPAFGAPLGEPILQPPPARSSDALPGGPPAQMSEEQIRAHILRLQQELERRRSAPGAVVQAPSPEPASEPLGEVSDAPPPE